LIRKNLIELVIRPQGYGQINGYKDAWYVGYTGNLVAGVWFGNDDSSPTNNMTGGTLPAMTWNQIMSFAHQGIELKEIPGFSPQTAPKPLVMVTPASGSTPSLGLVEVSGRSSATALPLSKKSYDVIQSLGGMFERAKNTSSPRANNPAPSLGKKAARPSRVPPQTLGQLEIISGVTR
jgi:penicillin-binding protein 1A